MLGHGGTGIGMVISRSIVCTQFGFDGAQSSRANDRFLTLIEFFGGTHPCATIDVLMLPPLMLGHGGGGIGTVISMSRKKLQPPSSFPPQRGVLVTVILFRFVTQPSVPTDT